MMNSSDHGILQDINPNAPVIELFNREHAKRCVDSSLERLLNEGKENSCKGKAKVHDMLAPFPPNVKRLLQPLMSSEFERDNAGKISTETSHSIHNDLSCGHAFGHLNESEDISTESDEVLEEDCRRDGADVTKDLIHTVKGYNPYLASSHVHDGDILFLKKNMVDCGGNSTQEGPSCSCSFCLKAAHMWTDLAFQDTRGRLTELQRSKKRAADHIAKVTQDFSKLSKSTKLEVDLMKYWKKIFIHTQDSLAKEITQTRSDLQARSKQMENCKRELELKSIDLILDKS